MALMQTICYWLRIQFRRSDHFDVDQIEVVRGSQTALYGSDTIGGVIN